jgi:acetyl esterase/lipase
VVARLGTSSECCENPRVPSAAMEVFAGVGRGSARALSSIALVLAAATFFVAAWSFLPPPTYFFLALAVAAPEVGAWLVLLAILAAALALPSLRTHRSARVAVVLALATLVSASLPLLRFEGVNRAFEQTMSERLGDNYLAGVTDELRSRMHSSSLDAASSSRASTRATRASRAASCTPRRRATRSRSMSISRWSLGGGRQFVQIYGGAWQRGAPREGERFARYLAAHGYVVFAIDYRHAPRWQWPAQLDDTRAALVWIAAHAGEYGADVGRLALVGRSSGAQLALTAAYMPDSIPVRAVCEPLRSHRSRDRLSRAAVARPAARARRGARRFWAARPTIGPNVTRTLPRSAMRRGPCLRRC